MFSRTKAVQPLSATLPEVSTFIDAAFAQFVESNCLCAGFLCRWEDEKPDVAVVSAYGIPAAPFRGVKKEALLALLGACLQHHPEPHLHSISSKSQQWQDISSFIDTSEWQHKALFIPASAKDLDFVLLCFAKDEAGLRISEELVAATRDLISTVAFLLVAAHLQDHLRVMEIYVREVGHDLASSVQAVVSKLRNVSRGLLTGQVAINKVKEAEAEILSAYRVADTLGITVDPDYNVSGGGDFDAVAAVSDILVLCASEAEERHIEIRTDFESREIMMWGDEKAIQSAVMQLLINAIKYAKGSTFVSVRVSTKQDEVEFSVQDLGKPLSDEEKLYMWDFGWRSDEAKELHVNGSGIGLYTVKKVASAHGGTVGAIGNGDSVTAFFRVPRRDPLKTRLLQISAKPVPH